MEHRIEKWILILVVCWIVGSIGIVFVISPPSAVLGLIGIIFLGAVLDTFRKQFRSRR